MTATRTDTRVLLLTAMLFSTAAIPALAASRQPTVVDYTQSFINAGLAVDRLQVLEVGGIVVIRGRTNDLAQAEKASQIAKTLGFSRVANLVQLAEMPNDREIERLVERALAIHRALEGCELSVDSHHGEVRLAGRIHNDLQKDVAIKLVRNIDGVRSVRTDFHRF